LWVLREALNGINPGDPGHRWVFEATVPVSAVAKGNRGAPSDAFWRAGPSKPMHAETDKKNLSVGNRT
jgi:hypothetical protein